MADPIFKRTGLVRFAIIDKVYPETMSADISFTNDLSGNSLKPSAKEVYRAQLPISYLSIGGGFIGGLPALGTPVAAQQAESGHHYIIVAFLAQDPAAPTVIGTKRLRLPNLEEGSVTIQAHSNAPIILTDESITLGNDTKSLILDTYSNRIISSFASTLSFSQSAKTISSIILRDKNPNTDSKEIGLDPIANTTVSTYGEVARNPARVEHREVIFEYQADAQVKSNVQELKDYNREKRTVIPGFTNRREMTNDTLSLSLVYPNQLMETIKGTVVDIYGNILDINRAKIPIGEGKTSIIGIKSTTAGQNTNKNIYEQIKRDERRSIAYHFEMNTRKETEKSGPPNPDVRDDYARDRSRFFLDIDKEGLFKLNVPASSSTGNIPLLTRYENYSTVNPNPRSDDPNDVAISPNGSDILIERFLSSDPIEIVDENNSASSPVDRFSSEKSPEYIGHGTAYHDISKTIAASTIEHFYIPDEFTPTTALARGSITAIDEVVSPKIITSGSKANAGGRSGSLNFDGSIEMNVGANEVDNQSLWLDTEGGILANVGEDKNGMSLAASLDGDVYFQLGDTESIKGKVFDLKVANGAGAMTVFRVDKFGVSISTQGRMMIYSSSDMQFRSSARMTLDAEDLVLNGRQVILDPGKGPIR